MNVCGLEELRDIGWPSAEIKDFPLEASSQVNSDEPDNVWSESRCCFTRRRPLDIIFKDDMRTSEAQHLILVCIRKMMYFSYQTSNNLLGCLEGSLLQVKVMHFTNNSQNTTCRFTVCFQRNKSCKCNVCDHVPHYMLQLLQFDSQ